MLLFPGLLHQNAVLLEEQSWHLGRHCAAHPPRPTLGTSGIGLPHQKSRNRITLFYVNKCSYNMQLYFYSKKAAKFQTHVKELNFFLAATEELILHVCYCMYGIFRGYYLNTGNIRYLLLYFLL